MPDRFSRFNFLLGLLIAIAAVSGMLFVSALIWALYDILGQATLSAVFVKLGLAAIFGSVCYWAWAAAQSGWTATHDREHAHFRRE